MNYELSSVLDYLEREKGVNRESLIDAVETSLISASKKTLDFPQDVDIKINRETLEIKVICEKVVVKKVEDDRTQVSLEEAKENNPDVEIGDIVEIERGLDDFGRIAAQTAKQVIIQKIKEAERDTLFNEYNERVGDVVTGTVRRYDKGSVILDLGRVEGILPPKEKISTEDYSVGTRVRCCVIAVNKSIKGPEIIVSRTHNDLVQKLFEMEVSEMHEGTVELKTIAREPGYRTKVAVVSNDPRVDALGACVGMKGARVKNIVKELGGEKVDIIKWDEDINKFVANAFSPVNIRKITIRGDKITVEVDEDQLSLCIGKKGQNARLCSKLTGYKIDIETSQNNKKPNIESRIEEAKKSLMQLESVTEEIALALVNAGFPTVEGILQADASDLAEIEGIDADTASQIKEEAASAADETHEE